MKFKSKFKIWKVTEFRIWKFTEFQILKNYQNLNLECENVLIFEFENWKSLNFEFEIWKSQSFQNFKCRI
jgi:hypothetical protein